MPGATSSPLGMQLSTGSPRGAAARLEDRRPRQVVISGPSSRGSNQWGAPFALCGRSTHYQLRTRQLLNKRLMIGFLASVFVAAGVLGYLGCGGSSSGNPQSCTTCPLPNFAGSWSGTWVDTRYNVSGAITAILQQTAHIDNATGTIDLRALGLGIQNGTAGGNALGNIVEFTFTSASVGSGAGTVHGTSSNGTGNVTAMNFGAFTFTGAFSDTVIDGTFNFTSPTGGHGTIHLTKQ